MPASWRSTGTWRPSHSEQEWIFLPKEGLADKISILGPRIQGNQGMIQNADVCPLSRYVLSGLVQPHVQPAMPCWREVGGGSVTWLPLRLRASVTVWVRGHSVLRPPETLTPKDAVSFSMIEMISDPGAYETSGPPDHPDPGNPKKTPKSGAKVG